MSTTRRATTTGRRCRRRPSAANAARFKIKGYTTLFAGVSQAGNVTLLKQALATNHPVAIKMSVRHGFDSLANQPSAVDDDTITDIRGDHEVLAVGYDAAGLIVENSWGTGWANGGFGRISWAVVQKDVGEAETIAGFVQAAPAPLPATKTSIPSVHRSGYWMLGTDGRVYPFGAAANFGSGAGNSVAIADLRNGDGYWTTDTRGNVDHFGSAANYGTSPALQIGERFRRSPRHRPATATGCSRTAGGSFAYGDAHFYGDMSGIALNGPIVASVATPTGHGYYMVGSDGGVFSFGDARFHGSTGSLRLNRPIVGISPTPNNRGYWLVASDGGVFAFDAPFRGSMGAHASEQAGHTDSSPSATATSWSPATAASSTSPTRPSSAASPTTRRPHRSSASRLTPRCNRRSHKRPRAGNLCACGGLTSSCRGPVGPRLREVPSHLAACVDASPGVGMVRIRVRRSQWRATTDDSSHAAHARGLRWRTSRFAILMGMSFTSGASAGGVVGVNCSDG